VAAALRRCLVFAVGGVEYAIDLHRLSRALPLRGDPGPAVVVHDASYPVVDLRAAFGLARSSAGRRALLAVRAAARRAALLVDEVVSLTAVNPADIQPLPDVFTGAEREWFEGLVRTGTGVVVVVRAEGLLAAQGRALSSPGALAPAGT
jgi:chemotaxis protein histidine kinase CheA